MKSPFSNLRKRIKAGFTLIELMVTIGIFVFMTALILARYDTYNSGTLLTNLAYDVALTVRHAQTYGLSVVASNTTGSEFRSAYGVNFDISKPTKFILFSDGVGNGNLKSNGYYGDGGDVPLSTYNLKRGAKITGLCVNNGDSYCADTTTYKHLNITFKRPDPNAIIFASTDGSNWVKRQAAEITVKDGKNTSSRIIRINEVGQISVKE